MKFEDFFFAVHGMHPFPWQCAAANRLLGSNDFVVTVPTGLGKTALIDAALFAAAYPTDENPVPARRIFFIVDRRIVVDDAYGRTQGIVEKLRKGKEVLADMNRRLGEIQVVRLRGGMYQSDDWILYPDKVTVVLSTVDQIGSRLLQRGYGVSPKRWPMHAGFVGNGSLYILDEAHISQPFLATIESTIAAGANVRTVAMSATLPTSQVDRIELTDADKANPIVAKRLNASKKAELLTEPAIEASFVKACIRSAERLVKPTRKKIAIVVNRVATARAIFKMLKDSGHRTALLTGRIRPVDRDRVLDEFLPEIKAGRDRTSDDRVLFVVATQTIEIGADLDFDGLVSEAASLSSLRQRFGRLDRLGELGSTLAMIILRDTLSSDPVYGGTLQEAWNYLHSVASANRIDFGLLAMFETFSISPPPTDRVDPAPTLLQAHLDLLAQTGVYAPKIDVSPWLHGRDSKAPETTVVWRLDLQEDETTEWASCAQLMPPSLREGLPMPFTHICTWLAGQHVKGSKNILSDLEGEIPASVGTEARQTRPVLRWRGSDDCEVIESSDIRPGDTIIVPTTYGGCDYWGWSPDSTETVEDRAEFCAFEQDAPLHRRAVRLVPDRFDGKADDTDILGAVMDLKSLQLDAAESLEDINDAIVDAREHLQQVVAASTDHMLQELGPSLVFDEHPQGYVVRALIYDDREHLLDTGTEVTLETHLKNVVGMTELLAKDNEMIAALITSAAIHDLGKSEMRMQILLHGNEVLASTGQTLAKSGMKTRQQRNAAYKASGLPRGYRHEFGTLDMSDETDPLIKHLVATHHGHGRPWIRVCADETAPGASYAKLASHWLDSFAAQLMRHGLWQLAELELILRVADARASIEEAKHG